MKQICTLKSMKQTLGQWKHQCILLIIQKTTTKQNKKTKRCTQGTFVNRYIASNTNINTRALNTDPWSCSSRSTGQVPWRSPGNDQTAASALFHSETVGNLWGCCPCPCSGDPIRTRWVSACRLWACMNLGWSWKAQTRHLSTSQLCLKIQL